MLRGLATAQPCGVLKYLKGIKKSFPKYLEGIKKFGILFERQQGMTSVSGYVDSYYARALDNRRYTTGYVFTCGGYPISWRMVLQSAYALFTTEAKYMTLIEASKEAIWLKELANEFGISQGTMVVRSDSHIPSQESSVS
ncbi:hypothetical protein CerSpe_218050 [Prunus speciosa]